MTQTTPYIDPALHWGAEVVDPVDPSLPSLKVQFVLERMPTSRARVLEIGCGEGKILRTIAKHHPALELHGCDVRTPRTPADCYEFQSMTEAVPLADGSMDVVLMFDVLEHVREPRALLSEAARVLRPGGSLLAFVPVEGERFSFYELYRRMLGRDTYVATKDHIQAFTHKGLGRLLDEYFVVQERRYAYHALGQLMDATFFAAARLKTVRSFWWNENAYYNADKKGAGGATGAANRLLALCNAVAWGESKILARTRFSAAGLLFRARPK